MKETFRDHSRRTTSGPLLIVCTVVQVAALVMAVFLHEPISASLFGVGTALGIAMCWARWS